MSYIGNNGSSYHWTHQKQTRKHLLFQEETHKEKGRFHYKPPRREISFCREKINHIVNLLQLQTLNVS